MRFLRPAGKFIPRRSFASNSETSEIFRQFHQNFETLKRENGPESKLSGLIDFNIIDVNKNKVTFLSVDYQITRHTDLLNHTRPIGLPPHAPAAQKLRISADSSLIRQTIGTFLYKIM